MKDDKEIYIWIGVCALILTGAFMVAKPEASVAPAIVFWSSVYGFEKVRARK